MGTYAKVSDKSLEEQGLSRGEARRIAKQMRRAGHSYKSIAQELAGKYQSPRTGSSLTEGGIYVMVNKPHKQRKPRRRQPKKSKLNTLPEGNESSDLDVVGVISDIGMSNLKKASKRYLVKLLAERL